MLKDAIERSSDHSTASQNNKYPISGNLKYKTSPCESCKNKAELLGISQDYTKLIEMKRIIEQKNEELIARINQLNDTFKSLQLEQYQSIQSEKIASLRILASGVAHEINNPLNFINLGIIGLENYFNENLKEHLNKVYPFMQGIQKGSSRASAVVRNLNYYSRHEDLIVSENSIHLIINNCLEMLHNQTENRIEILKKYANETYRLVCNEGKLHQVILNVIANACQAIENKGTITITTKIEGEKLLISIVDSGRGISKENLNKILDPFFTTNDPGKGTGLGLSIAYNILQEHSGTLEYDSILGKGTKVIITLPIKPATD